jgi:hypothetical protein
MAPATSVFARGPVPCSSNRPYRPHLAYLCPGCESHLSYEEISCAKPASGFLMCQTAVAPDTIIPSRFNCHTCGFATPPDALYRPVYTDPLVPVCGLCHSHHGLTVFAHDARDGNQEINLERCRGKRTTYVPECYYCTSCGQGRCVGHDAGCVSGCGPFALRHYQQTPAEKDAHDFWPKGVFVPQAVIDAQEERLNTLWSSMLKRTPVLRPFHPDRIPTTVEPVAPSEPHHANQRVGPPSPLLPRLSDSP